MDYFKECQAARDTSLDAMLEVLSKLIRSARPVVPDKEALCNREDHYKSLRRERLPLL